VNFFQDKPDERVLEAAALIKEAKRRQERRRWTIVAVLVAVVAIIAAFLSAGSPTRKAPTSTASHPMSPSGFVQLADHGLTGNYEAIYRVSSKV